jgi:hypothetical protein
LKTSTVPPDHGIGRDHNQAVFPRRAKAPERNPEQLVLGCQSAAPLCAFEHGQLLAKQEIFDEQVLAGMKQAKEETKTKPKRSYIAQIHAECWSEAISQAVDFTTARHFL